MPTQGLTAGSHGLGAAVKEVAERASSIVRLELELAAMELKTKVISLGIGIGLPLGAALLLLFMLGFALRDDRCGARDGDAHLGRAADRRPAFCSLRGVLGVLGDREDQERHAAAPRAGDPGSEADDRGAEERWPAATNTRTVDEVRRDIESEREQLAGAAETFARRSARRPTSRGKLRANLPAVAVGALGVGFLARGRRRRNRAADLPARTRRRDEGQARPLPHCRPRLTGRRTQAMRPSRPRS